QKLEKGHAAYRVDHPLKQEAVLYINAGGKNPKDVLVKTIKDLVKDLEKLEEEVIKAAGKPGAEA
ncbi:MAG: RpoL/Rpb11 RNA polymerase subunit family protein, partial [Thermoproteota archaeon]